MYAEAYTKIRELENGPTRADERQIIGEILDRLRAVDQDNLESEETIESIGQALRLWNFLMDDLVSNENGLPENLRADLISIGVYVTAELDKMRDGEKGDLETVISVTEHIFTGLK